MKSSNNSIACPLAQAAVQFPDMPALESSVRQVTYKQYHNCVGTIAERLASEGVHSGDRVAIVAETCIEYVMLLMAIIRAGAIACPLSLRNPASLLKEQIASLNAKTVVQDRDLPDGISSKECHSMAIGQLCHNHDLNSKPDMNVRLPLDCDASILFTSGSANKPKAVVHTIGNHYYSALGSNENINLAPGDRWMLSLPLYHVGGLAVPFRAMLAGAAVFVPSCGHDSLAEEIAVSGITHLSIVPAQLSRLLDQMNSTNTRLPQLKAVLVGGDAVGPAMVARALEAGLPLYCSYGLTEMASQVTTTLPGSKCADSGKLLPYRKLRVLESGEILVGGQTLARGYLGERPFGEWFATGDVGLIDEQGALHLLGRIDNMLISGGENIHPEEIERSIELCTGIEQAIVVGLPDEQYGHRPVAFVRAQDNQSVDCESLSTDLEQHLPRFKLPIHYLNWPDDPEAKQFKPNRKWFAGIAQKLIAAKTA